jgi:hypothetical protein
MTRTTERRALLLAAFLACAGLPARAAARGAEDGRLFASASAAFFHPLSADFRRVYDRPGWPLELQLGLGIGGRFDLLLSGRRQSAQGETVAAAAAGAGGSYPLRMRLLALRLGVGFCAGNGAVAPYVAGGLQHSWYREKWADAGAQASGGGFGLFAQGGCRLRLNRVFQLVALLDYSYAPMKRPDMDGRVDLGGIGAQLGIRAAIL